MLIHGFKISNTNSSRGSLNAVRVYNDKGEKIAEVNPSQRNPLAYVRKYRGRVYQNLRSQCIDGGMTEQQFSEIFGAPL